MTVRLSKFRRERQRAIETRQCFVFLIERRRRPPLQHVCTRALRIVRQRGARKGNPFRKAVLLTEDRRKIIGRIGIVRIGALHVSVNGSGLGNGAAPMQR